MKKDMEIEGHASAVQADGQERIVLKITQIEPNREQPRKKFEESALLELSESIRQFGLLQPILVQKKNEYYEIVAGERRWRAAKLAGLKEVPVIIRKFSELELAEISLIENIQRENLNPIEEAHAYKRLLDEFHLKQEEIAERVCKSRAVIANTMRLLKLDERVQEMLTQDKLSAGHARALVALEDKEQQVKLAEKIAAEGLSVRTTEQFVRNAEQLSKKKIKEDKQEELIYRELEEKMRTIMGTKVVINRKQKHRGKIEIEYYSIEELERILDLILSGKSPTSIA